MNHDACDKAYAELRADKIRIQEELEAQVAFLKTALASARIFVAMDSLPENALNDAQMHHAIETLALIDSLIK